MLFGFTSKEGFSMPDPLTPRRDDPDEEGGSSVVSPLPRPLSPAPGGAVQSLPVRELVGA